jgi:hypothetical protein
MRRASTEINLANNRHAVPGFFSALAIGRLLILCAGLNQERFIAGRADVRNFGHFGGVSATELAKDPALADASERLARYREGRYQLFGLEDLKRLRGKAEGWGRGRKSV